MEAFSLTPAELVQLRQEHRHMTHRTDAYRINAIILLGTGWTQIQVSEALLLDERTIRRYVEAYRTGGIDALLAVRYKGSECYLNPEQIAVLDAYLVENVHTDAKAIIRYIKATFSVEYSVSGLTQLLKRMDFVYKKPKHVPGKQDPEKQREFVDRYEEIKANKGKNDQIYFADATHPQHNSIPSYGWIKKGVEKDLKANCGRQRLNINGAINIETLEPVVGIYDTINAQATIDLFAKMEAKHPEADVIYVIIDNAKYYRSQVLQDAIKGTKIKLEFLPPYSPNLNLIERYWKFLKKKVMNNQYYETFDEFKQACESFFRKRKRYLPELQTLLTENFHIQPA